MRQQQHIPSPTRGCLSATIAARPKTHKVTIDRIRMIRRTPRHLVKWRAVNALPDQRWGLLHPAEPGPLPWQSLYRNAHLAARSLARKKILIDESSTADLANGGIVPISLSRPIDANQDAGRRQTNSGPACPRKGVSKCSPLSNTEQKPPNSMHSSPTHRVRLTKRVSFAI